ncbi:MAG: DUF4386 domain-containing protein [bacterium]
MDTTERGSPSTSVRIRANGEASPVTIARITGVLYLLTIVTGIFAQGYVSERLVNLRDAAATAANILAQPSLFRLGFAVYLVEMGCQMAMTVLFYQLLKPVSRNINLVALSLGFAGCVIKTLARLFYYAPLFVLGGAPSLGVFNAQQLQSLALLLLKVNDQGAAIALVFFGAHTVLHGWLVLRSRFLPRTLGVISMIGGAGWLAFLFPPLGYRLFPVIAVVGLLGSAATIVWLLVYGVNEARWRAQASAAATSIWR